MNGRVLNCNSRCSCISRTMEGVPVWSTHVYQIHASKLFITLALIITH